jgi:hypothetical protein
LGVLHRDVKPANILIDAYNNAGLADFGLAALIDPDTPLSETVEAITPAYAPPEVFAKKPLTEYADVYSLAATLYAVLSGRAPRWSETTETPSIPEIIKRQKSPIRRIHGVDKAFMDVLLNAMAESPEDRPTAAQLRDQLTALNLSTKLAPRPLEVTQEPSSPPPAAEEPVPTRAAKPEPPPKPSRRWEHRGLATLAIAALVIAVTSVVAMVNLATRTPAAEPTRTVTTTAPASPTITQAMVPAGFIDCSEQLGNETYCASQAECWAEVQGLGDLPWLGNKQDCNKTHVYQTFIAGRMTYELRRQSQLESDAQIRRICTTEIANSMLRSRDRRSDWEIWVLGPQQPDEYYFRCILGRGERTEPLNFHAPG